MTDTADEAEQGLVGVLVCDDNAAIRDVLTLIIEVDDRLAVGGYAADGNEAIAEAERLRPQVITLDLAMPRLTGLEALPELRAVAPEAAIVVFSAFAAPEVVDEVLRLGASSYVQKGGPMTDLVRAIIACLDR